jgi:MFS family permease
MSAHDIQCSRIATAVVFCVTGAVFATWAARIPAVQERMHLSSGGVAVALLGIEAGALVGLPAGGSLVARIGSARSLRLGFALYPPAMASAAVAASLAWLTAGLAVMGAANSLIDVAANVQGVELERHARRPLLSGLHSGHSFGVLGGGLVGTAAAALGIDTTVHLGVVALGSLAAGQAAATVLLGPPTTRDARPEHRRAGRAGLALPNAQLVLLGGVACCAFFVEGAANDWSAVHLSTAHAASPAVAAAAFTAFSLALAVGRLFADRLVAEHGRARFAKLSGLIAAAGACVVALAPSAAVALAGWTLLGAGIAAIAPTFIGAASAASQAPPSQAIATVTTIGYSGSFAGPPVIGALGTLVGISSALGALVAGSLAITLLAGRALRDHHARPPGRPPLSAQIAPRSRQYYDPGQRTTCPEGGEIPANQPFL